MTHSWKAQCRLCREAKPLVNSHVIPELLYVPLYDEKHRLLSVKDDTPGSRFL